MLTQSEFVQLVKKLEQNGVNDPKSVAVKMAKEKAKNEPLSKRAYELGYRDGLFFKSFKKDVSNKGI